MKISYLASSYAPFLNGVSFAVHRRTGTPALTLVETDWLKYAATYFGRAALALLRPLLGAVIRRMSGSYDLHLLPAREFVDRYRSFQMVRGELLQFHGVDTSEFVPENRRFDPIPQDHRPVLLFVSRLVPEKSPLELLDAFAAVRERVQTAHLVIVGSGQLERQTRRKTARFGAAVTFAGEAYGDTLKGWYARADMLLNPSATEAFSTVNLEAMASGTPVIAAASGGNLDQIIPERNGLFSRPHDPADLAAQIIALLTDPPRLAKMSSLCRESVLPLDWNACCERLEHEMLRLVANRRPAVGQLGVNSTRPAKAAA